MKYQILFSILIIQHLSYVLSDFIDSIQDDSDYSCFSCHSSCYDCDGPLETDCIDCFDGYKLTGGQCKKCDLNNQQFLDKNDICLDCDKSCQKCSGTPTNCTQCIDGLSFFPGGSCQFCDTNKGFYLLENKDCDKCGSNCKQCTNHKNCTVCESNFTLINGECLNHLCEDGTYLNEKTNKCELCYPSCKTCTGNKISDCNDIQININQSALQITTGVTGFVVHSLFAFTPLQFVVSIFDFAQSINFLLYINVKYDKPVYFILKILDFSNFFFVPTVQQSDENVPLTHYREKSTSNFLINLIQPAAVFAAGLLIYLVAKVSSFKRNEKPNTFMKAIYFISDNFFFYIFVGLIYLTFYRINMAIQLQLYNFGGQIISSVLCLVALAFQIALVLLGLKSQQNAFSSKLLANMQKKFGQYSKDQFLINGLVYDEMVEILSNNARLIISAIIVSLIGLICILQISLAFKLLKQKREALLKKKQELKNI